MGVPVRITTWNADESVSNSDLNAEFNIGINALSDGTKDANIASLTVNGTLTSSGNSTAANVTANGVVTANTVVVTNPDILGDIKNLGLTLSGGLLSITDRTGAALSATNFGVVTMTSATAGTQQNVKLATPVSIRDDSNATSDFTNNEWGVSAGANWAQDVPFFIYVVNKSGNAVADVDGNSAVCISRNPAMTITPSAANSVGKKGTIPVTDTETNIILWGSTYTVANYVSLPVQLIGAVRMQYATSTHDWTIQTLSTKDGIGPEQLRKTFATEWAFPVSQNGADAGTHIYLNSGITTPAFTTNNYQYKVNADGKVLTSFRLLTDAGANGSGAVTLYYAIPYRPLVSNQTQIFTGVANLANSSVTLWGFLYTDSGGAPKAGVDYVDGTSVLLSFFDNGTRTFQGALTYSAF